MASKALPPRKHPSLPSKPLTSGATQRVLERHGSLRGWPRVPGGADEEEAPSELPPSCE